MCASATGASSRALAVWMALPRSDSRKYILRLMLVSSQKHDSPNVAYPAALAKSGRPRRNAVKSPPKLARQSLANVLAARGKSGLHRAGCWVTPRRRKATKRATETSRDGWSIRLRVAGETRQPPPGATSNRRTTTWLAESAGRWLEPRGNPGPRGMTVQDRTRLIGQLHFFRQRAAR